MYLAFVTMTIFAAIITILVLSSSTLSLNQADQQACSNKNLSVSSYNYFCNGSSHVFKNLVRCHKMIQSVSVHPLYCLTYWSNQKKELYEGNNFTVGVCPFKTIYNLEENEFKLPKTINLQHLSHFNEDHMCLKLNRTGVSCGACNNRSAASLNSFSFDCLPIDRCHDYSWAYLLLADLVPVTILFAIVVMFDINIISGYANTYVLFCQVICIHTNFMLIEHGLTKLTTDNQLSQRISLALLSFYSVWSLDMGRILAQNICIGKNIGTMDTIALMYIPAFYSLLLVSITYLLAELHARDNYIILRLCKPFSFCLSRFKKRVSLSVSLINAFATFFLLSYSKLTVTSLLLISPTYLYNINSEHVATVYLYDGTTEYFTGWKAIFLSTLGFTVLLVFVLFPSFLLLIYRMKRFQRFLKYFKLHRQFLVVFMDAFQNCYKDGMNRTSDCRWFSAVYLFYRIIVFSAIVFLRSFFAFKFLYPLISQGTVTITLLLILYFSPYKNSIYNKLDITMFAFSIIVSCLMIVNGILKVDGNSTIVEKLLFSALTLPLIGAVIFVGYHIILRLSVCMRLSFKTWHGRRNKDVSFFAKNNDTMSDMAPKSDFTPSLPDRLIHPYLYSENMESNERQSFGTFQVTYGSTTSTN